LLEWTASPSHDRILKQRRFCALLCESGEAFSPRGTIKVTGTNGNGSVCAMLEACLCRAGLPVGLFTTPHPWHVGERCRENGIDVDDNTLERHAAEVERIAQETVARRRDELRPSFFETLVVVALRLFREQRVDIAIYEGGIGGYHDPVGR